MLEFWGPRLFLAAICAVAAHAYTAAVLEHVRYESASIQDNFDTNLKRYWEAALAAKQEGVDLLVFPEIGLQHLTVPKEDLEQVPKIHSVPCFDGPAGVVSNFSCMARNTSMVIVANKILRYGNLVHNTNLVFNRNGSVLARYFKIHLFLEEHFVDPPREKKIVTFQTDFGKFGTFICFDLMFKEAAELMEEPLDAVVFPYTWHDNLPMNGIVQMQSAFAVHFNQTLIGSGIHHPYAAKLGSGIFNKRKSQHITWEQDGKSRLVISKLEGGTEVSKKTLVLKDYTNALNFTTYRYFNLDLSNYTMVRLTKPSDKLETCNNGLCCRLAYSSPNLAGTFYLGVFNGTRNIINRYFPYEENCFMAECKGEGNCTEFAISGKTVFNKFSLHANFSTRYVYPSVMTNNFTPTLPRQWRYHPASGFSLADPNQPIVSIVLYGRKYDLDK